MDETLTDELTEQLNQLLDQAEEELGRPLEEDEVDSITEEFLAGLDEEEDESEGEGEDAVAPTAALAGNSARDRSWYTQQFRRSRTDGR